MRRALLIAVVAYAWLDFANPLIPGAVNFNDDHTVLAARSVEHSGADLAPVTAHTASRIEMVRSDVVEVSRPVTAPVAPRRRFPPRIGSVRTPVSQSPDASDDH
jgi:hypothetical protein